MASMRVPQPADGTHAGASAVHSRDEMTAAGPGGVPGCGRTTGFKFYLASVPDSGATDGSDALIVV